MAGDPLPHSLDLISDYLATYQPPHDAWDPGGDWERRFVVWVPLRGAYGGSWDSGSLRMARARTRSGGADFLVALDLRTWRPACVAGTRSIIHWDKPDSLDGPWQWQSDFELTDASGKRIPDSQVSVNGHFASATMHFKGKHDRTIRTSPKLVNGWMLFDLVQRLPFDAAPMEFDLMEESELLKPRQRLRAGQPVGILLGGRQMTLHCFEQTGEGILPRTYWLDDQHRLLFVTGGFRNYLHDPREVKP